MMFFTQINFKQRKIQERHKEINAHLVGMPYTSRLNDWSIRFIYRVIN